MTRRKTDGERIANQMLLGWALSGEHVAATAKVIDRLIRKRMAEAWEDGWLDQYNDRRRLNENPYRGRRKK
ncbi:MAG: hypothetical protein KJS95_11275 [Gammaproteobacteria bacterium]|nr:hypothetical protein [Gammaproteobacteria bacterium]